MTKIVQNGNVIADVPFDNVEGVLVDLELVRDDVDVVLTKREETDIRERDGQAVTREMHNAGVSQTTLIGTLADLAGLGAYGDAICTVALGVHGTDAQKAFIAESGILPTAEVFLAGIKSDDIKIPALEKGPEKVLIELKQAADAYNAAKEALG